MNDRFKFRAWEKKEKKMYEVIALGNIEYCDYPEGGFYNESDEDIVYLKKESDVWQTYLENAVLMQCTGLKDKNGKLIYEGDIVQRSNNIPLEIKWHKDGYHISNWLDDIGIIGNIYENPELLTEHSEDPSEE